LVGGDHVVTVGPALSFFSCVGSVSAVFTVHSFRAWLRASLMDFSPPMSRCRLTYQSFTNEHAASLCMQSCSNPTSAPWANCSTATANSSNNLVLGWVLAVSCDQQTWPGHGLPLRHCVGCRYSAPAEWQIDVRHVLKLSVKYYRKHGFIKLQWLHHYSVCLHISFKLPPLPTASPTPVWGFQVMLLLCFIMSPGVHNQTPDDDSEPAVYPVPQHPSAVCIVCLLLFPSLCSGQPLCHFF
jgi:hypothetical protein